MNTFARALLVTLAASPACRVARMSAQQPDTVPLTPIVVTATRSPEPSAALANAVSVLGERDLARAGIVTVADAIRALPGVAVVQNGSFGSVTSLFIRGGQSDYVRVLVDGVPVNATGGYLDLANLSTLNVERVELVRGPASVLYGSDAISGVMQIFTRRWSRTHASASLQGGTYGSSDASADVAIGSREAGLTLAAAQQRTDGIYDFNSGYRNRVASGSLVLAPGRGGRLVVTARYSDALFHYPTDGLSFANDSNQFQTTRALTLSLDASRFLTPHLEAQVLLGFNESRGHTDDEPDNASDTAGLTTYHDFNTVRRASADLRLSAHAGSSSLFTVGGVVERESDRDTNDYVFGGFGPGGGALDTSRTNRALYAQALGGVGGRVWVQAGARLDDNDKFGTFGTWRLGATALVAAKTRARVNVGRAFKEPTFDQTYSSGFVVGNPDLRPERSLGWEAGLEQSVGERAAIAVTYFDQRFRNMIEFTTGAPGSPNYANLAAANASGIEVEGRIEPAAGMRVRGEYTWLDTRVVDAGDDSTTFTPGRPLLRRPEHSASLVLDLARPGRLTGGARLLFVGRREDLDFTTFLISRVVMPSYSRIDLWGEVAVSHPRAGAALTLTARLDNVLGTAYQEVYRYRTPGRMLRVGVRMDAGR